MAGVVGSEAGIIAIDRVGGIGIAHRTEQMPFAWVSESHAIVTARIAR